MHSTGSMLRISTFSKRASSFLGWMQSTGQASTQAVSLVPTQGSAITYAIFELYHRVLASANFGAGEGREMLMKGQ